MFEFNNLSKNNLFRYMGMINQVAGIQKFCFADGMAKGMPACLVKSGSGLSFTVLEGRCMDIYSMEYKGINLAFYYKNGLASPERITHVENEFMLQASGGMMYTSGLQNSGPQSIDGGLFHPLHGRISAMSADDFYAVSGFDENEKYIIELGGRVRESRMFGHNLNLHRKIKTALNSNTIEINDTVENETCRDTFFSILYHINLGYPLLDDGTYIVFPKGVTVNARTEASKKYQKEMLNITKPIDNFEEHLYYDEIPADDEGLCNVMVVNPKLNLGVHIAYEKRALPYFVEWKSMSSGDYALGMLPSNNLVRGRHEEMKADGLPTVKAFSKVNLRVLITVVDGNEEIDAVTNKILKL